MAESPAERQDELYSDGSDIDGVESLIHDLSLEEDPECPIPKASTPKKSIRPDKRQLTPNSKLLNQPRRKKLFQIDSHSDQPDDSLTPDGEETDNSKVDTTKPSSNFYKERRENYAKRLLEHFEEEENSEIPQQIILEVLQLDEAHKAQATNAVRQVFPKALVRRKGKERVTVYAGVSKKHALTSSCSHSSATITSEDNSDIANLKLVIASVSSELDKVTQRLACQVAADELKKDVIQVLVDMQRKLQLKVRQLSSDLDRLYDREIQRLIESPSHSNAICSEDKEKLNTELETFITFLNIGLETESLEVINFQNMFTVLPNKVRENCPLVFDVLDALFLHKTDGRNVSEKRVKSAVHSLALLISLKSQKIKNDLKIMFTCLCISFGAGLRFITTLNKLGLTVSWDTAMSFFDRRKAKQQEALKQMTPLQKPVILMFDNVNMYRGKHKHLRLFKSAGPVMWNFTCQAVLVPNTEGLEEILQNKHDCVEPQRSALEIDPEELFIENDQEKKELFTQAVDWYLLHLLDTALNRIPVGEKKLKDMTEKQVNYYLANSNFETSTTKYNINILNQSKLLKQENLHHKSDVHVLPLSLENNSTIVGTISILDQLATDFSLPNDKKGSQYIPFDSISKTFDVKLSRNHYEIILSQQNHQRYMRALESQLYSKDKELANANEDCTEQDDETSSQQESTDPSFSETTLESERRQFGNEDKPFWDTYNHICSKLSDISTSNSEENYLQFVNSYDIKQVLNIKDHLRRSLLHAAVEQGQENLVKCFVDMGINVNAKEGCGMTPLNLAVLHKNVSLCKFLLESGAKHSGPLFTSIPSPMYMADTLNIEQIKELFKEDQDQSEDEDRLIRQIAGLCIKETGNCDATLSTENNISDINRSCHGFVTPVVGDVGTCKTNNAAMTRSAAYRWIGICPGDLHNKGYYCEAVFKVHGSSGLHYILCEIMKRKKLTVHAFKKKKFQEGNLLHIREATRDVCKAYGLAAVLEFLESSYFPGQSEPLDTEDFTSLILARFKEWISESSSDLAFQHRATAFVLYGPLQMLYDLATSYCDGNAREIVFQLQLPIYTQLGFTNYSTEVLRHVINFLVKWPLATRKLLQQNCSVNLSGKEGHGIELDAFVESEVVQPLKNYTTGHTTVTMCKRIMANIDVLKYVRGSYMGKEGFDIHHTSRHSEQTPLPDQVKGAWFCLQKGFFKNTNRKEVECYPLDQKGCVVGKVPQNLLNVVEKGKKKISEHFTAKLYDCFPDLRYDILS